MKLMDNAKRGKIKNILSGGILDSEEPQQVGKAGQHLSQELQLKQHPPSAHRINSYNSTGRGLTE